MLTQARNQFRRQAKVTAAGLSEARRIAPRGPVRVATVVGRYQAAAAKVSLEFAPLLLSEQGIKTTSAGRVAVHSLLTGGAVVDMLDKVETDNAFDRLVMSLIADAGRTAMNVDAATRPAVTGYVRSLMAPSCSRCAVLAGRVYRYSQGFQRHPRCDCLMTPTDLATGQHLVTDPQDAFDRGLIRGMSKADAQAIRDGADIGQVVNVRRKSAGLVEGSSVLTRGGRPTPSGIYRIASDKPEALALMRRFGYVL